LFFDASTIPQLFFCGNRNTLRPSQNNIVFANISFHCMPLFQDGLLNLICGRIRVDRKNAT